MHVCWLLIIRNVMELWKKEWLKKKIKNLILLDLFKLIFIMRSSSGGIVEEEWSKKIKVEFC